MEYSIDGLTILVVEDEPNIRRTLRRALADGGAIPLVAGSATDAMEVLEEKQIDILLLDLRLPDFGGLAMIEIVHRENPNLPIVSFSAYASPDIAAKAFRLGASDFLEKPFTAREIRIAAGRAYEHSSFEESARTISGTYPTSTGPPLYSTVITCLVDAETVPFMLRLAGSVSQNYDAAEIIAVSTVEVPRQTPLKDASESRETFSWHQDVLEAISSGKEKVNTRVRQKSIWTHDGSNAVLELLEEYQAAQVLLEWRPDQNKKGQLTTRDVQKIAKQTSAEVILARFNDTFQANHIAVLVSESPHSSWAARRAWDLARHTGIAKLTLLHLPDEPQVGANRTAEEQGFQLIQRIANETSVPEEKREAHVLPGESPQDELREALTDVDVVFMGATSKSELAQRLFGSFVDDVRTWFQGSVIVVQGPKYSKRTVIDELVDRIA